MNFKIIENISHPVLIMRDRTEEGDDWVRIIAWLPNDLIVEEKVAFTSTEMANQYISDFSLGTASAFIEKHYDS